MKTIELDCAPGFPRPGELIGDVVRGTPLEAALRPTVSRFFGCWTWDFSHVSDEEWNKARPTIKARVETLFHIGSIRYGSW